MALLTLAFSHASLPPLSPLKPIKTLIESTLIKPSSLSSSFSSPHPPPIQSLLSGNWVKLITGASFEDAADIRNLSLVYTLAGVDCIDCAAEASVVSAVNEGIDAAMEIASIVRRPWVMISVNDDREDVHFRKAEFDPEECPPDCSKPCERVCPANAISLRSVSLRDEIANNISKLQGGVITERCYGCGRCFPVCPYDKIRAMTYVRDPSATSELLKRDDVDAIEIHTSGRHTDQFDQLWNSLSNSIGHVKLVSVSLPDVGESTVSVMNEIYSIMEADLQSYNLWQLDGQPMSGDIGGGATRKAIAFALRLASQEEKPPGFYQLAGGTNSHTIDRLKSMGLFQAITIRQHLEKQTTIATSAGSRQALIGGIAYGGYARKIVGRMLSRLVMQQGHAHIEDYPELLLEALQQALILVGTVKSYNPTSFSVQ